MSESTDMTVPDMLDETAKRQLSAVALRVSGANYGEIARTLGFSTPQAAKSAILDALSNSATEAEIGQVRNLNERRLNKLLLSCWAKATDDDDEEHLQYVRMALAIIDRHSKLMGADAPSQMVVHTPDQKELVDWVSQMANQVTADGVAREADIIDAEIEEEGEKLDDGET